MNISKFKRFLIKNHLYVLVAAAIILLVISVLIRDNTTGFFQLYKTKIIGRKVLPELNKIKEIEKIIIFKPDKRRIVINKKKKQWVIVNLYNYNADKDKVNSFLEELKEARIIQVQPKSITAVKKLELELKNIEQNAEKSIAAKLKLYDKENKPVTEISIGKRRLEKLPGSKGKLYLGRYVLCDNYSDIIFTDCQFTSTAFTKNEWLDKQFPKIKNIRMIKLYSNGRSDWQIQRGSYEEPFALQGIRNKKIEESKIYRIENVLNNFSFKSVADPSLTVVQTGFDNPKILSVETFYSKKYIIKIGKKVNNFYYVKIDAVGQPLNKVYKNWVYLIDSRRIEALLVKKKFFKSKPEKIRKDAFKMPIG
ncbi:MAG: DUF4340 domain-containing protein [Victivallales bacterium]|nr:DUF4340 domain-containing protein [Victivallales bacterium]MCF7889171.1 DUF4340 domain-containing protein [Victivallales bacterium]